jgi:cold shock CspA family protein
MTYITVNKHTGTVKMFNGQFGFITSDEEDVFFHKSGLEIGTTPDIGDTVKYTIEPSRTKKGKFQATQIRLMQKAKHSNSLQNKLPENLGHVDWYDDRGYGMITNDDGDYFFHISKVINIGQRSSLKGEKCLFDIITSKKHSEKKDAINLLFIDELAYSNKLGNLIIENIQSIGLIDNEKKFKKAKEWLNVLKSKKKNYFFNQINADVHYSFEFWLNGIGHDIDLEYVTQQLFEGSKDNYSSLCKQIFDRLTNKKEQETVLTGFLESLDVIDNSEKYYHIKTILKLDTIPDSVKKSFFAGSYERCNDENKCHLWIDEYTQTKDLAYISKKLCDEEFTKYQIQKIFKRLTDEKEQETVLTGFLESLDVIDNSMNYNSISAILELDEIPDSIKKSFLAAAYEKCNDENKYRLWIEKYTQIKDLAYILKKLSGEEITYYPNLYKRIFERLNDDKEQEIVLNKLLIKLGNIDSTEKYSILKRLDSLDEIPEKIKTNLFTSAFELSKERKFLLWFENYTEDKDLSYVAQKLTEPNANIYAIYERLVCNSDHTTVLNEFLIKLGKIDSPEKFSSIKSLVSLDIIPEKIKAKFLTKAFDKSVNKIQCKFFIELFWIYPIPNSNDLLSLLLDKLSVYNLFDFCIQLIEPLPKINTHDDYNGFSYLQIYLENPGNIKEAFFTYGWPSVFQYDNRHLNTKRFENKLKYFNHLIIYISINKLHIIDLIKEVINQQNTDKILKLLKEFNSYCSQQKQLCNDLKITEPIKFSDIENFVIEKSSTADLLKYWLYDFINHFNFNEYCFYYFTLTLEERKIFNKKAKAIMGEDIKNSMLKKREPWQFIERIVSENKEIEVYSAKWKSIWFEDNFIRVCTGKEPSFSKPYNWDFSEEKFNLLFDFISGRRIKELKVFTYNGEIQNIEGLENLEEVIWKIQIQKEVEEGQLNGLRGIGANRIPVNMILRNQCIQFLNKLQFKELKPTWVLEKTFYLSTGSVSKDISLLYSIQINEFEIAIIWESLELEKSKATHIFKCLRNVYESVFSNIEFYLSSKEKVRSSFNSNQYEDVEQQKKLQYFCRINHDNFKYETWENSLLEVLPELKTRCKLESIN